MTPPDAPETVDAVRARIAGIPALSIMQPWTWLIAAGHKPVENRTWRTSFRGRVLLHAGLKYDGRRHDWDWPEIEQPEHFDMGGIVGEAEIVACVTDHPSPWFCGPFGFVMRNARPLPFLPCRGQLGFFHPDFTPRPVKERAVKPAARQGAMF